MTRSTRRLVAAAAVLTALLAPVPAHGASVSFVHGTTTEWGTVAAAERLMITGRGFPAGRSGRARWRQGDTEVQIATFTAARDGTFAVDAFVPRGADPGPATATACLDTSAAPGCDTVASANATVARPPPTTSTTAPTGPGVTTTLPVAAATTTTSPQIAPGPTPTIGPAGVPPPPLAAPTTGLGLSAKTAIPNIRTTQLEVTQGVQNLDNEFPLVKGRRTYVRVYGLTEGASQPGVMAALHGVRQGGGGPQDLGMVDPSRDDVTKFAGFGKGKGSPVTWVMFPRLVPRQLPVVARGGEHLGP